jgi:hypothetical protein
MRAARNDDRSGGIHGEAIPRIVHHRPQVVRARAGPESEIVRKRERRHDVAEVDRDEQVAIEALVFVIEPERVADLVQHHTVVPALRVEVHLAIEG